MNKHIKKVYTEYIKRKRRIDNKDMVMYPLEIMYTKRIL